tara:strand:+ start:130 stop:1089 length:960 start_codon:yes stop_codon:yes gene_type:complete
MTIVLMGYNGLIGDYILKELSKELRKGLNLDIVCVGRDIRNQPVKNKRIKYVKWNFIHFTRSKLFFLKKKNIIINCIGKNQGNNEDLKKTNLNFIKKLSKYILVENIIVRLIHMGSVSVYGAEKKYFNRSYNINENTPTNPDDSYSKNKLDVDLFIKQNLKLNRKMFSYTILRIANVFSETKNSNSFKFINNLLNRGIWLKCSHNTNYHYIHARDVAQVVILILKNQKKTKNNTYIVSDEVNQSILHKKYSNFNRSRLIVIPISLKLINLIIKLPFLPKSILNFFLVISSQTYYNNNKIKKVLNFRPKYSLRKEFMIDL